MTQESKAEAAVSWVTSYRHRTSLLVQNKYPPSWITQCGSRSRGCMKAGGYGKSSVYKQAPFRECVRKYDLFVSPAKLA